MADSDVQEDVYVQQQAVTDKIAAQADAAVPVDAVVAHAAAEAQAEAEAEAVPVDAVVAEAEAAAQAEAAAEVPEGPDAPNPLHSQDVSDLPKSELETKTEPAAALADEMIINIKTTDNDRTIGLPFGGNINLTIDWGEDNHVANYTTPDISHIYKATANYKIRIAGTATSYGNNTDGNIGVYLITDVKQWGNLGLTSLSGAFFGATELILVPATIPLSVTDMSYMFYNAAKFNQNISGWDTTNVTNMNNMFEAAYKFNQNISDWKTENVETMSSMFHNAHEFNQDISRWNTENVTNMNYMFDGAGKNASDSWNRAQEALEKARQEQEQALEKARQEQQQEQEQALANGMIINIKTTAPNQTIELPFGGSINLSINWGDSIDILEYTSTDTKIEHSYSDAATYIIRIAGSATSYGNGSGYVGASLITDVSQWENLGLTSLRAAFYYATELTSVPTNIPPTVTDMSYMFAGASKFNQDISGWNTTNVKNMSSMFESATAFNNNNRPLSWNTENVTNMSGMFYDARAFNQDISGWDTKNVTDMNFMFYDASAFNQDISRWNTKNVTDMSFMFYDASAFNQDISGWNTTNVTIMNSMFAGASKFNQDISEWDTTYAIYMKNMNNMFLDATDWDTSAAVIAWNNAQDVLKKFTEKGLRNLMIIKITTTAPNQTIELPFGGSINLSINWGDSIDISEYTSTDTKIEHSYSDANAYIIRIAGSATSYGNPSGYVGASLITSVSQWGELGLESLRGAFYNAPALISVPTTIPSTVTDVIYMFADASAFNQNISGWNTENVENMNGMFAGASKFNQNISDWNTTNVTNMSSMFLNASAFNQDISKWKTDSVTNMKSMFRGALAFNHHIEWYTEWYTKQYNQKMSRYYRVIQMSKNNYILGELNQISTINPAGEVDFEFNKIVQILNTHFNICDKNNDGFIDRDEILNLSIYNDVTEAYIKYYIVFIIGKFFASQPTSGDGKVWIKAPIIILRKALDFLLDDHDKILNIIESIEQNDNMITYETYTKMVDDNKSNATIARYINVFDYSAKLNNVSMALKPLAQAKEKAAAAINNVKDITRQLMELESAGRA
jgi:surface protein